jgi:hypothetical protein
VHELEPLLGSEARPERKGEVLLLGHDVGVAELLDVVHTRHALHHLLDAELPQTLKVNVPKALVPPPSLVVATSYKAQRLLRLSDEDVVVAALDLSKKKLLSVPDAQHVVLDLHTQTVHVQLSKADDGVA